jgi:hypothetical protein
MSIKHTQKGFRYSIIAMFTGFAIILIGILNSFGLFGFIGPGAESTVINTDINDVVIAGSVVAELISACFILIFTQSQRQFEYFYNRQMQLYDALLTFRMANSMSDVAKDRAKEEIIKGIIETSKIHPAESKNPALEKLGQLLR